ncbi:MAG: hypothetical protein OHK005_09880 [Candidatus Methylacidiphilales bacterium]
MTRVFLVASVVALLFNVDGWAQAKAPSREYQEKYQQAAQAFANNQFDEALRLLDEADKIEPNVSHGFNLRGAIFTKKRDFDQAEAMFKKTLEIDPGVNLALFNLGEVAFLQKSYPEAKKRFQRFIEKNGSNDLGEFKIFLCDLMGGNVEAARKAAKGFPLSPTTPLRYYALAAVAFQDGKEEEAVEYIRSAAAIYPAGQNNAFADSFLELGWLKRAEQESFGLQEQSAIPETVLRPMSGEGAESAQPAPAPPNFEGLLPGN